VSRFKELRRSEFEKFLIYFSHPNSIKNRNNKLIGLNREGKPFTVHIKHGSSKKFPPSLVEAVARSLGVSLDEFLDWYNNKR
jgi:hypothetical protein